MDLPKMDRRKLLTGIAATSLTLSPIAHSADKPGTGSLETGSLETIDLRSPRRLQFFNTHTGEELDVVYHNKGAYQKEALTKLNILLRDHRQNEAIVMDKRLFDQLWQIQHQIGTDQIIEIISGYRSPATNALLRKRSRGVASKSFHMYGRAIDFRLRHTRLTDVRTVALSLKAGGVGYYRKSDFIHIDTGNVRSWS